MKQTYVFLLQTEAAVVAESEMEAWLKMSEDLPTGHEIRCLKGTQTQVEYAANATQSKP